MRLSKQTEDYIRENLGRIPDSDIALATGLSVNSIHRRRRAMNVTPYNYHHWGREEADEMSAMYRAGISSIDIAKHFHVRLNTLRGVVDYLNKKGYNVPRMYIPKVDDVSRQRRHLTDQQLAYLYDHIGKQIDIEIAKVLGTHPSIVGYYRRKVGIEPVKRSVWTDEHISLITELWHATHSKAAIAERLGMSVKYLQSLACTLRKQGYDIPYFYEPNTHKLRKPCTD